MVVTSWDEKNPQMRAGLGEKKRATCGFSVRDWKQIGYHYDSATGCGRDEEPIEAVEHQTPRF